MHIRNFAIIAHIDHGKSTLADRLLELTGTVKPGSGEQLLDTMELERERGITIKLNPARMSYEYRGKKYQLNLIDTPGHVDFNYEVSRSLSSVEGVILLVDASQGIQAQTITNLTLVRELGLKIIPAVNKIDLPNAQALETAAALVELVGCDEAEIVFVSGKTGEGVESLLQATVERFSPPPGNDSQPLRAMVFDSFFDPYLGVVAHVKVVDGHLEQGAPLSMMATRAGFKAEEIGYLQLDRVKASKLANGEIGYLATGLKKVADCRVGDTVILQGSNAQALTGYKEVKSMVFASFFPEPERESELGGALDKLKLSDASLKFEPIYSKALGPGYSVGFLGLLHLEIIKERLEREYGISVLVTTPTVAYRQEHGQSLEPWVELEIVAPKSYFGPVTQLASQARAVFRGVEYLGDQLIAQFEAPLAEIIIDFYDRLKSISSGYASMDYRLTDYRPVDLAEVELLIASEKVDALTQQIVRTKAQQYARSTVRRLKTLIPRQSFEVSLQAAIGGKIIARADIPALRKDVTAKLYGGDITRKKKLLEKQKRGKKKMRLLGRVEVPSSVFVELLRR